MNKNVDNALYDWLANTWWDETSPLYFLKAVVNPGRVAYLERVLAPLGAGARVLEVGCGGGLLTEEITKLGFEVMGLDPSASSIKVATAHAASSGLEIDYCVGVGEQLPFADAAFDAVCCCDVLEHAGDPNALIREAARVLEPGGRFVYSVPNRTLQSYLTLIWVLQRLPYTRLLPAKLHDWRAFIAPSELKAMMAAHGLTNCETVGLSPTTSPWQSLRLIRKVKRGELTFGALGEYFHLKVSRDLSVEYAGYGIKPLNG